MSVFAVKTTFTEKGVFPVCDWVDDWEVILLLVYPKPMNGRVL